MKLTFKKIALPSSSRILTRHYGKVLVLAIGGILLFCLYSLFAVVYPNFIAVEPISDSEIQTSQEKLQLERFNEVDAALREKQTIPAPSNISILGEN